MKHQFKIILLSLLIPTVTFAAAFESYQVGSSPSNGYLLQTNGSVSTWVATSSLGISQWINNGSSIYYNSGDVGIGTTTPGAKLHVLSTTEQLRLGYNSAKNAKFTVSSGGDLNIATSKAQLIIDGDTAAGPVIDYDVNSSVTATWTAFRFGNGTMSTGASSGSYTNALMQPTISNDSGSHGYTVLKLNPQESSLTGTGLRLIQDWQVGNNSKMVFNSSGKLGIGTTTPVATLSIHDAGTSVGTTKLFQIASSTSGNGTKIFTVLGNEKVGIGTESPAGTLSVRTGGTVAGGTIYFDNFTCGAGYAGFSFNGDVPTACGVYNFLSGTGDKALYINRPSGNRIVFRENNGTQAAFMGTTGNLQVGSTTNPSAVSNKLSIYGNASIGATYENITAPTDGLIVKGNVGFGTTTPLAKLDVYGTAGTSNMFNVSSSTNISVFKIDSKGHRITGGSLPTISIGLISGNDNAGRFTIPTSVTTATITFAQSWVTTPSCIVNQETGAFLSTEASSTPTTFVITNGITVASTTYNYQCIGF